MTDPTPRPPVGTDLAPCPDCGGDLTATVGEDTDGQWWDLECDGCGWLAQVVDDLAPFTLAGAPWTRALWAEVERLRAEAAELRLELAAEQGRQEGAPSEGWEWDARTRDWSRQGAALGWILVDHRRGATWYADGHRGGTAPTMRAAMRAADEAEAQAAAKELTPAADIYDQALTVAMSEPLTPSNARDLTLVQALRPTGPARSELSVRCPVCDAQQTLRPLVCEGFECHGHSVTIHCEGGRIVSWTERSPVGKEPTAAEHSGRVWLTGIHGYHLGKFEAVKAIRSVAGLGLREAMTLVESVSTEPLIPLRADRDRAADIAILRAAGCQLRIEEPTP